MAILNCSESGTMDRIDVMRAFVRVMERRSFVQAARDLGIPRSRVSEAIRQLERQFGLALFARTTRQVAPTSEGEEYYARVLTILAAVDEADAHVAKGVPAGPLRIDVHGTFARRFLMPGLADFLAEHPDIRLHIGEGDRLVDLVAEGVDCVIRIGEPSDSGLIGRKLGMLREGTFASADYVARHGMPASPDDLDGHRMIGFVSSSTHAVLPLEFEVGGGVRIVSITPSVTVNAAASYVCLAQHGLGLIQVPRYRVQHELASGSLVEVLAAWPPTSTPVYLLHPSGQRPSPRLRRFMDWATREIGGRLDRIG